MPAVTLMSQVFFTTFFGFLGLLLALPLTVVGQVWLQEILVKDILDKWHLPGVPFEGNSEIEDKEEMLISAEHSELELME